MHFLILGNVSSTASGYTLELRVVDASTDRVLTTGTMDVASGVVAAAMRYKLTSRLDNLTWSAGRRRRSGRATDRWKCWTSAI